MAVWGFEMKPARKSKTMWLNWAGTFLTVAAAVQLYLPDLGFGPTITAWAMLGLTLVLTFGNKLLRMVTKEGIG